MIRLYLFIFLSLIIRRNNGRPKKHVLKPIFTDKEMKEREGTWIEESDIKYPIITNNTDVWRIDEEGKEVLSLIHI